MLPKEHRLKRREDFDLVMRNGRKVYGFGLGLRVGNRIGPERPTRFGFVINLKFSKNSVDRNRLRRQLREVVRVCLGSIVSGFDVVVSGFPEAKDFDFKRVSEEMIKMLKKAQLLRHGS